MTAECSSEFIDSALRLYDVRNLRKHVGNSVHVLRFLLCDSVDIQVLMGSLLYLRQGIKNSPYAHLFNPIAWTEIADTFIHDSCTLLGLSVDSPLSIVYV